MDCTTSGELEERRRESRARREDRISEIWFARGCLDAQGRGNIGRSGRECERWIERARPMAPQDFQLAFGRTGERGRGSERIRCGTAKLSHGSDRTARNSFRGTPPPKPSAETGDFLAPKPFHRREPALRLLRGRGVGRRRLGRL